MADLAVLDIGLGNVKSVVNACRYIGFNPMLLDKNSLDKTYSHIIMPGVGNFGEGSKLLSDETRDYLDNHIKSGHYLMGICLGMQLLFQDSDEADGKGLGFIPASITSLTKHNPSIQVPRLGWKKVSYSNSYKGKLALAGQKSRYYFVHSFGYVPTLEELDMIGINDFISFDCSDDISVTASVEYNNIIGTQYHPEKSSVFGLDVLHSFVTKFS